MSPIQSYERVLGTLAAEARIGRLRRTSANGGEHRGGGSPRGRAWINGREVGGPNLRFAHLHRDYE